MKLNDILTEPTEGMSEEQKEAKRKSEALFKKANAFTKDLKNFPRHEQGKDTPYTKD